MPSNAPAPSSSTRLLALLAAIVVLFVVGYALGIGDWLDAERIRALVERAGPWGIVLFVALWVAGTTLSVPSIVFIAVAALMWGPLLGGLVSYVASLLSVSVAFVLVRRVGGSGLASIERPWLQRALVHVSAHPIRTAALVRLPPLFLAPVVTYTLALTGMRYRDFLIGTALGIVPGLVLFTSGAGALLAWLLD